MIYVAEFDVANKATWGDIEAQDFIMPQRVHHIRGVLATASVGAKTIMRRLIAYYPDPSNPRNRLAKLENIENNQIGSCSFSINGTDVIVAGLPVIVATELEKGTYNKNLVKMEPKNIAPGSLLRISLEEKHSSPFLTADEFVQLPENVRTAYGKPDNYPFENAFTLKCYIDYD